MDQDVAAADAKHHHQPREQHEGRDARLDQLPHDPQTRLVQSPRLAAEECERDDASHGRCRSPETACHELAAAPCGGKSQSGRQQGSAPLHHSPDGLVVDGRSALQAVGAMTGEDHGEGEQATKQRHGRAPEQPPAVCRDVEARHLGGNQVHEHHQADRAAAWKRKPACEPRFPEDRHGQKVGERDLCDPAVEILGLDLGKVFLVLGERADEQQERGRKKHHDRDLERTGGPEQRPGRAAGGVDEIGAGLER